MVRHITTLSSKGLNLDLHTEGNSEYLIMKRKTNTSGDYRKKTNLSFKDQPHVPY